MTTATRKKKPVVKKKSAPKGLMMSPLHEAIKARSSDAVIAKLITYEEYQKRDVAKSEYFKAMKEFQNEIPDLPKVKEGTDKNGKSYKYCPLPLIKTTIQPYVYKYGFIYRWDFKELPNNKIECTIILTHSGGHSETSSMTADRDDSDSMNNIQSIGSTRTYLQRYTLIAVLGLATAEEDNDGINGATKTTSAIPEPNAISKERLDLEGMELNELVLKVEQKGFEEYLTGKFGTKRTNFTEKEKSEIKKHIIDTLVNPSLDLK